MLVYTVGTFDMLHVGHLALLEQCRSLGDDVVVGVASDSVVNSYNPYRMQRRPQHHHPMMLWSALHPIGFVGIYNAMRL